jgi:hypothetical protein
MEFQPLKLDDRIFAPIFCASAINRSGGRNGRPLYGEDGVTEISAGNIKPVSAIAPIALLIPCEVLIRNLICELDAAK